MPASITISNLSWSTPDGRTLFSNLDLSFGAERAGLVGRNGIGKSTLLRLISGDLTSQSGKVSVSGNLGILHQAVEVVPDRTIADLLGATEDLAILRRAEAGEATGEELAVVDWALEARIAGALGRVGLNTAHEFPWLRCLVGNARAPVLLPLSFLNLISSCWMSRPTTSIAMAAGLCSTCWPGGERARSS
jgi:ATPase subunit of ABC transporter with duplicated ATPase domains